MEQTIGNATWDEVIREAVAMVEALPLPARHCARNALHHIEKARAIKDIDPDMAAFRAVTAEEEIATAIFHALVELGYAGAEQLDPHNHQHKAALVPFLEALYSFFAKAEQEQKWQVSLVWSANGAKRLYIRVNAPAVADRPFYPTPPLHFSASLNAQLYDFNAELAKIASDRGVESLKESIRKRANRRNKMLYANVAKGIPSLNEPIDALLQRVNDRVHVHLILFLLIAQHPEKQDFVQQALDAFVKLVPRLKKARRLQAV